jgi:hypothetical protein
MSNTTRNYRRNNQDNKESNERSPLVSRTLVISSRKEYSTDFTGKVSEADGNHGTKFVSFDTQENAQQALQTLMNNEVRCKYSYYKIFFRITDRSLENISYDDLKEFVRNELLKYNSNLNVLRMRFNRTSEGTFIGSGDMSVDLKNDFDNLLDKKQLELHDGGHLVLYKYNMKKKSDFHGDRLERVDGHRGKTHHQGDRSERRQRTHHQREIVDEHKPERRHRDRTHHQGDRSDKRHRTE